MYILDTDHLSLFQRGFAPVVDRLSSCSKEEIAITIISVEEQLRGRLDMIRKASTSYQQGSTSKLIKTYENFQNTFESLNSFPVLSFNTASSFIYTGFKKQKIRVGNQDLKIAAIALAVNGVLVTRNQQDFVQIPGLLLEDWTVS